MCSLHSKDQGAKSRVLGEVPPHFLDILLSLEIVKPAISCIWKNRMIAQWLSGMGTGCNWWLISAPSQAIKVPKDEPVNGNSNWAIGILANHCWNNWLPMLKFIEAPDDVITCSWQGWWQPETQLSDIDKEWSEGLPSDGSERLVYGQITKLQ